MSYFEDGSYRFAKSRGRTTGSMTDGAIHYPSPFFDIGHTYLPTSVKELFRWCRYYFYVHPLINTVVFKLAQYPITDLMYQSEDSSRAEMWKEFFEDDLQYRSFMLDAGIDYWAYGNQLTSIFYPFIKMIKCRSCNNTNPVKNSQYAYRNYQFHLKCTRCGHDGDAEVYDHFTNDKKGIRLLRWNPEDIEIRYNDLNGEYTYYYEIPNTTKNDIMMGRRDVVENIPQLFIDALRLQKTIVFSKDNIFHMKRSTLAGKDRGWGTPLILPVLKDAYYLQLMKKAQEVVMQEHIIPLRILFPQAGSGDSSPYSSINLREWRDSVQEEIQRWRIDPAYIPILPLPIGNQAIGGDGRALMLSQEIRSWSEQIVTGMGVPVELIFGGVSWCLDPDSYIFTSEGMRQIKDYMPEKDGKCATNFKTVTHTGNLQKVTLAHKTKHKGAIIKTRLGLDAYPSHDHKYYVLNPDLSITWKKAKDLNPGDMLAVQLGANLWATEAPDLTGLVLESEKEAKLLRKKDIRNRYPVSILGKMTPELARLLGYLVSEGHVTSARHGFAQKDKEILFDFLGCVEKCFGYRTGYHTNKKGVSHTGISRKEAFIFIEKLGISGNSWTKEIPWVIKQSPKEFVVEFLRGYFEGDGGTEDVWVKQKVMATTVSYELARQIQLILGNLGILSSRYFNNNKWYIHIRSEYVDAYAEIVGFVSSRKKEILECRTPTGKTHMGERLPYVKEVLDAFRENNFISRAAWFFDPISLPEDGRDIYTVSEAADLVGRDYTTLHFHIRKGRLKATKQGVGPDGKFLPSLIRKDDLLAFLESFGLSRKRTVPGRDAYGMTYNKLEQADLSLIKELDPKLYDKLKTLLETRFVWNEVISVELLDEEFEMGDLTVEEDASYSADGLVCHNSSTNVSLRMLENTYLGYMSDHYRLVRWVMKNIGAYLEWEPVTLKFKPFKMADDLQRKAYNFQLNQASKISDEALLRDADFDPDVERKTIISETNRSAESMKKTRLAQAEIEGEASLIQMRYQLKAQKEQMEMTQQAPAQGEPGAEVADATQGQTPEGATNQGAPEEPESQPENVPPQNASPQNGAPQAGMANVGLISSAQQLANYIFKLDPQSQNAALANLQEQNPELYSIVLQLKESVTPTQGGNANSASLPLPEQRPPRRGIESASI